MAQRDSIVELRGVSQYFGATRVLDSIDLSIANGEFLTILGPSGCGKTTILRCIAGFEKPTSGDIFLAGQRINDLPPNKRKVNTVFQSYTLFPHMNVFDNVAFGLRMQGVDRKEIGERVRGILRVTRLEELAGRMPGQLSGGQQQRVAIARAVVNNPLVLLLDEPLSALDAKLRKEMQFELKHLRRELGITFIFVTHDQKEAFSMSDRVVVMNVGRIEQVGTPVEVYEAPETLYVASFVGETNILDGVVGEGYKGDLTARVEGKVCSLRTPRRFSQGEHIKVLLRPEDIRVARRETEGDHGPWFPGTVIETTYHGTTYDLRIALTSGKELTATEFFNENATSIAYREGERVLISWFAGWETVLSDAGT
ncbi:MAG: spermidine/putrescine ABC transporter ATP-binding protein PotA [Desulfovibrionaceae bacterium]